MNGVVVAPVDLNALERLAAVDAVRAAPLLLTELRKYWAANDRMYWALRSVTGPLSSSDGCPGEDRHGRGHMDIFHVAPYHCAPDACPICDALTAWQGNR